MRYGTPAQKRQWLEPLLAGDIRSGFAMTEPAVASSGRHQHPRLHCPRWRSLRDQRPQVVDIGAPDPRCKILIFMGQTDPDNASVHKRQSMVLVPMDTPGVTLVRALTVFGYDHAPHGHGEVDFANVRVPLDNILLGEGCGFEIAQGRLGPGRIHHCMRMIGLAERALELMCQRALDRVAFHRHLAEQGVVRARIADARLLINQARLLTLNAAWMMDVAGNKVAKNEIAMIKVAAPAMACQVIDWAMQVHGGAGVSSDFRSPPLTPRHALCVGPMVPTRCIETKSPSTSWRVIKSGSEVGRIEREMYLRYRYHPIEPLSSYRPDHAFANRIRLLRLAIGDPTACKGFADGGIVQYAVRKRPFSSIDRGRRASQQQRLRECTNRGRPSFCTVRR